MEGYPNHFRYEQVIRHAKTKGGDIMKETKKGKDVKNWTRVYSIKPVFPGKEQHTNQAFSQCGCACYCSYGTDQTATDLRTYDTYK